MKRNALMFLIVMGFVSALVLQPAYAQTITNQSPDTQGAAVQATRDNLIAIDVLIEPDQTMMGKANAANARLRENLPTGYELDATHAPHVTLLQRFVRAKDFDAVTAALSKVFAVERPTEWQLKVKGYEYVIWGGVAVTVFVVERTPELMRLHQKVIDAMAPFSVSGGTTEAFVGTGINAETIGWVETFVPKSSGQNYLPHVTVGVAKEDFAKQMRAEPFDAFTFKASGVAMYQLGNFGTAAKKLWQYQASGPLASWNEGAAKQSVLDFVRRVTTEGSPDFVPVPERIATFDNDGTLWCEQPLPVQLYFVLDRVRALAPQHPEWKTNEPFASLLKGDLKAALAGGERALLELAMATHTGMTTVEFEQIVKDWIAAAKHPKTGRLFTEMIYQPMFELLEYLRANGFKTYIVSGGGIEFMRAWAERVYGIPPEQIVGSCGGLQFVMKDDKPVLEKLPTVDFVDDGPGKPVGIQRFIGRRPVAAFGNSDGDLQMLEWTTSGDGLRLGMIVHHTDAEREWAYDRNSPIGKLDKAMDEASSRGWTLIDMKKDWKRIYAFEATPN